MGKRKDRSVAELYKRTLKMSKPRITPILEGSCRMQGPLDESECECETDTVCRMGNRSLEVALADSKECSISPNATKICNNKEKDCKIELDHNTGDTLLIENKITGNKSLSKHTTGKLATEDFVESKKISGSKKTRISSNVRRARGNKTRKTGTVSAHSDYGQKADTQTTCAIEQSDNFLESPGASQSNYKEEIVSFGKQLEKSRDKCLVKEPDEGLQFHETSDNADTEICHDNKDAREQEEDVKELPPTKPNDASNIDTRDSDSVGTAVSKSNLDTCNMTPVTVSDEKNETDYVPGIKVPMPSHSDSDFHVAGSKNSAQTDANGDVCNDKDLKDRTVMNYSSKLENTDELTATCTESLLAEDVFPKGISESPDMINAENASTIGLASRIHSEKEASGLTEESVDVIQKAVIACGGDKFVSLNDKIQNGTATETTNMYGNNSFPGHSLSVNGKEPVDLSVECGPLDHSSSSSLEKREPSNRLVSEGSISHEAVCSFPLSVTPVHSSATSVSQSVLTAKEIEAHSSSQQEEDFAFTCSTVCSESSSTKNPINIAEEAKDVFPVLPTVLSGSPEHHKNDHLKRSELDQDIHVAEANKMAGPSELVISSEVSLPCEETEKSCEPLSGEDVVKVCDICGDTGYEEMLAVCIICNDGAEHTYCMQSMLEEVPESDWLCEGCKLKQNVNVKRTETPPSLTIISKPACLNSRKQNFYGTARSRLSAKLDKKKLVPERKRALKGIPSSQVSTKRQAEAFEVGPATKKLSLGTSNSNLGLLSSNAKSSFSRENSFKALDLQRTKTSIAVSSTGNLLSSSLHDSSKSSTLYGASSPRLPANVQLSKIRPFSLSSRMTDSSAVTGTSKPGNNVPSAGLATHTVKISTDPCPPLRLNSFQKVSTSPKVIKESTEVGWQAKVNRENTSSSHAVGAITKSLKSNTNTDSPSVSDSRTTSDVHNLETKEMRTGKVTKDGPGLSRRKAMTKSLSIPRDSIAPGATNLEKLTADDRYAKPVTFPIKDSSKSRTVLSEEKKAVAPTQVALNSNKEHSSLRFSEERTQLKASPSKLQGGVTANKLQRSASAEVFNKVSAEKSKQQTLLEIPSGIKSTAEANVSSSSVKDDKKSVSLGDKLVAEGYASQPDKKSGIVENKPVSNEYPSEENKKTGNFKKFSSLKWSSPNYLPAIGSTRCYKCKELGHSAQSCKNRSFAEAGSSSLRVSSLIASAARNSRDIPDTVNGKLSIVEETAPSGNYDASGNDQRLQFDSDEQDNVQQSASGFPRQVLRNKETSYANLKSNSMQSSKGTTDLNGELDIRTSESCQISIPYRDFGRGSSNAAQILTTGLLKSSLVNHSSTSSKTEGEKILHTGFNDKKSGVADSKKYSARKRLLEGEASFHPGDISNITTTINPHTVFPAEDTVVAIRRNASYSASAPLDGTFQPSTEMGALLSWRSSQVESTKETSLPEHNFLWQGGFEVQSNENGTNYFDGIQAHASTSAASKVLDAAKKFSSKLQLDEVPRHSSWPRQFHRCCPSDKNIALYFFAKDHESYERPYRKLLERMLHNDFALRGNFDGVELLVFPSNQLVEKSQRWNRLLFLWGVFRERKSSCIEPSKSMCENIPGESAKRNTLGSNNLNVNDSPHVHLSSSGLGFSELEDINTDRVGDGESNASQGTLGTTGDQILPSVSSQGEGPNDNYYDSNIPNSVLVEDRKTYSTQKIVKAAEPLSAKKHSVGSLFESNEHSNGLKNPDLPPGFETSIAEKLQSARDDIICQETIPLEAGQVTSEKWGEVSSSNVSSQTEKVKPNNLRHTLTGSSAICLSSTERKTDSCDTSRIAHFHSDSPCQQENIDKGKKRPRNIECDRQMEGTKEMEPANLSCKDGEMGREWRADEKGREDCVDAYERERDRDLSSSREEDYSNCESKNQRDGMPEGKRPCPSRTHSSPQLGVQSHSPTRQIYNDDFQYSRTHSPDLDHVKLPQASPGWQVPETIPDFVRSSHKQSSNNIAVDGKEVQGKTNKSYGGVQGRENGKEQDTSGLRFAEPKMSSVPTYHIADLNQVADFDAAVEFSGTSVQKHIQREGAECSSSFQQESRVKERVFFPCSDDINRDSRTTKLSGKWPLQIGSKQNSFESSSTFQLISSTEKNQEQLDLNIPSLDLALGGKITSSNSGVLPAFVPLLDKTSSRLPASPLKGSSVQGTENGSSLALSLAFPLSQSDQTAKTLKDDYTKPVNCSVNTSFCLFGHRLNG